MSTMSYIGAIERYHEYKDALREILASIVTGIADEGLLGNDEQLRVAMERVVSHYPFVEMVYTLDVEGMQNSSNVTAQGLVEAGDGRGRDRSQRPYYRPTEESSLSRVHVTEPYLSSVGGLLCISASQCLRNHAGDRIGFVVLDINLAKAVEFLMGDIKRRRFTPLFTAVYTMISLALFLVVLVLLYAAGAEMLDLWDLGQNRENLHLKPFGVIIFITLALAIFDLGKTILEEEVLMHKDIFRHSSTRRTITRFIAAILIAVSIEALLLMFKGALGIGDFTSQGVWMMGAAIGLLIGLGIYVYLGAQAESLLTAMRKNK